MPVVACSFPLVVCFTFACACSACCVQLGPHGVLPQVPRDGPRLPDPRWVGDRHWSPCLLLWWPRVLLLRPGQVRVVSATPGCASSCLDGVLPSCMRPLHRRVECVVSLRFTCVRARPFGLAAWRLTTSVACPSTSVRTSCRLPSWPTSPSSPSWAAAATTTYVQTFALRCSHASCPLALLRSPLSLEGGPLHACDHPVTPHRLHFLFCAELQLRRTLRSSVLTSSSVLFSSLFYSSLPLVPFSPSIGPME